MKQSLVGVVCLILFLTVPLPAAAQFCPEPGAGADVVEIFIDACEDCDNGPAATCREDYEITLLSIQNSVACGSTTFVYEVLNTADTTVDRDLVHWVLGVDLEQFELALAEGKTLSDLFKSCSVEGLETNMDCGLVMNDPTTQLGGIKFEAVLGDGESKTFSFKLREWVLKKGNSIEKGCVVAATKAGDEDIQRDDRPAPGYVCIAGPITQEGPVEEFVCPKSQGYWKNHVEEWPIDSIELGCETYTKEEARAGMRAPVRGDASLILAKQLIAAKLNIDNGSNPAPATETIEAADELLCSLPGRLPYQIRPATADGHKMIEYAQVLNAYNNGWLTPSCIDN